MRSEKAPAVGRLPLLVVVQLIVTVSPGFQPLAGSTATCPTLRSMKGARIDWNSTDASLLVSADPEAFSSATAFAMSVVTIATIRPTPALPVGRLTVVWRWRDAPGAR